MGSGGKREKKKRKRLMTRWWVQLGGFVSRTNRRKRREEGRSQGRERRGTKVKVKVMVKVENERRINSKGGSERGETTNKDGGCKIDRWRGGGHGRCSGLQKQERLGLGIRIGAREDEMMKKIGDEEVSVVEKGRRGRRWCKEKWRTFFHEEWGRDQDQR